MNGTTNMKAVVASSWEVNSRANDSRPITPEPSLASAESTLPLVVCNISVVFHRRLSSLCRTMQCTHTCIPYHRSVVGQGSMVKPLTVVYPGEPWLLREAVYPACPGLRVEMACATHSS